MYEFLYWRTGRSDGFRLSLYLRPLFSRYAPASADCLRQKGLGLMCRTPIVVRLFLRSAKKMRIRCGLRLRFLNSGLFNLRGEHK